MTQLCNCITTLSLLIIPFLSIGQCPTEITYTSNKLKLTFDFAPNHIPESFTFNSIEYILNRAGNSNIFFTERNVFNEDLSDISLTFNYEEGSSSCAYEDGELKLSLPVELIDFEGSLVNNNIHLKWSTLSENNNAAFEIQYSTDGIAFTNIGAVLGMGDSETLQNYNFIDKDIYYRPLVNTIYYRLKQVDFDGSIFYSDILAISLDIEREQFEIIRITAEKTFDSKLRVSYFVPYDVRKVNLLLVDNTGRIIERRSIYPERGLNNLEIDHLGQHSTFYFLSLDNGKEVIAEKIALVLNY